MASEVTINNMDSSLARLEQVFDLSNQLIQKSYLQHISALNVDQLVPEDLIDIGGDVRIFKLERLVSESRELMLENAMNTYLGLGAKGYKVFFIIDSDGHTASLYIGVSGGKNRIAGNAAGKLLTESFNGHFPGSKLQPTELEQSKQLLELDHHFKFKKTKAVTALSSVSSLNLEEKNQFVQGMERFLDAASGRVFRSLILAEPLAVDDMERMKSAYEGMSTDLSAFQKNSMSFGTSESDAVSDSFTESISETYGKSVTKTFSQGWNEGRSVSHTEGSSKGTSSSDGKHLGKILTGLIIPEKKTSHTASTNTSTSRSDTVGRNASLSDGQTDNYNFTASHARTLGLTKTVGKSVQQNIEIENKSVSNLMDRIDKQIERVDAALAYGGWNLAAYFISEFTDTSEALSSMFLGLTRGEGSHVEPYAMTTWNNSNTVERDAVLSWLSNLHHPRMTVEGLRSYLGVDFLTPAVFASGQEMALQLSMPRRSTPGVTVVDAPSFGRTVQVLDLNKQAVTSEQKIRLGVVRHLWRDDNQAIDLEVNRLNYHSLVTGTTGVGKTTTIKSILAQLHGFKVPFMVIEPAKGEYVELVNLSSNANPVRHFVAGRYDNTGLKLNPFVFPDGVALTDHIDRITTVFNAAFSMYGPMPQLLEEAIFAAYEELGWVTYSSVCVNPVKRFPTVLDVLEQIPLVVKALGYSEQVVGDFVGALMARLKSLTRGSLGMTVLCSPDEETSYEQLFSESSVVDLSAMGSPEKRAMVMGLLFMRLYEYRLAQGLPKFENLQHLMVLEEAHVLLKKTSKDQSQESSNTTGMAVEAFANALAEMRAYGQGFMVADQSASAIDDSVLRNTNTKIVMRAPYEADRLALGGALALDEEQTRSLAKLENHTAVVFQSNWLEPVLCRLKKVAIPERKLNQLANTTSNDLNKHKAALLVFLFEPRFTKPTKGLDGIKELLGNFDLESTLLALNASQQDRVLINNFLASKQEFPKDYLSLRPVVFKLALEPILGERQMSLRGLSNRIIAQLIGLGMNMSNDLIKSLASQLMKICLPESSKQISEFKVFKE
ncbi:MAG: DUF853 family protein [Thiomicrospira sp.]|jgi:hypothetical protein|nr:DUF853 family protein [Thiomicrospira sp.]